MSLDRIRRKHVLTLFIYLGFSAQTFGHGLLRPVQRGLYLATMARVFGEAMPLFYIILDRYGLC